MGQSGIIAQVGDEKIDLSWSTEQLYEGLEELFETFANRGGRDMVIHTGMQGRQMAERLMQVGVVSEVLDIMARDGVFAMDQVTRLQAMLSSPLDEDIDFAITLIENKWNSYLNQHNINTTKGANLTSFG